MRNSSSRVGRLFAFLGVGGLLLWLAIAQLPGRSLLRLWPEEVAEAEWIWSDGPKDRRSPVAFYALRDFELSDLAGATSADSAISGSSVPGAAFLEITADEEYDAFLNGYRLGSGRLDPAGRPVFERWPASHALRPGGNRLTIEVRSARGAGGLLARLVDAEGRPGIVTDDRWRISRRALRGMVGGWQPLDRAEPALTWGPPPVGRWGGVQGVLPRTPPTAEAPLFEPRRARILGPDQPWYELSSDPPVRVVRRAIPGAVFDFGEAVTGHLHLGLGGKDLRCALAYVGMQPADPFAGSGHDAEAHSQTAEVVPVVLVSGARHWRDTVARKFRYVTVLGSVGGVVAWVEGAPLQPPVQHSAPRLGVEALGIQPPRLRTPIEDEVGRELQSFPGLARGKDL